MAILLYEVMWGFMQPTLAHRIARAAAEDGIAHPDLDNFVKMGPAAYMSGMCGETCARG